MPEADILIVGASGLVGTALRLRLGQRAAGTAHRHSRDGLRACDITDAGAVDALIEGLAPKVILHTAALTDVNYCELHPEDSRRVNVEGTRNVARAAARAGARYLFFSTDYVFGGAVGPHRVDEPFDPVNVYGRHKLEAERIVADTVENHVLVRACNLYGYQPGGKNFVIAVFEMGRAGKAMRVPSDQWGSPTLATDIAAATEALASAPVTGAVHVAGPDYVDRLTLARRAARCFGLDAAFLHGVATAELGQAAPRPLRGGLDGGRTELLLGMRFVGIDEGLARMRSDLESAGLL